MNKSTTKVQMVRERFITMMSLLLNTHVGKRIDGKKMIKNQITRSDAYRVSQLICKIMCMQLFFLRPLRIYQ